jgi:hypothetical protein
VVFVDKLSKMIHIAPCKENIRGPSAAHLFMLTVAKLHGLPKKIISDRDPLFTSKFWKTLFGCFKSRLAMSTANHPRSDGQD